MINTTKAWIPSHLPIPLCNLIISLTILWRILWYWLPILRFTLPISMSYKSFIALPVLFCTFTVFNIFYSFPLFGVKALRLSLSSGVCYGSTKEAIRGDPTVWSSELVVWVGVGWVIGALTFSLVDWREINRYQYTLLLLPTSQRSFSIDYEFLWGIRGLYNNISNFYRMFREFKLLPRKSFVPGVINDICCFLITCHNN